MTTPQLKALSDTVRQLRRELNQAEDDYLELREREKKLGAVAAESDAELAEKYGLER